MPDLQPILGPIGNVADVLSMVTAACAIWAATFFWRARRTYRRRLRALESQRSRRPCALAVGLGGGSIEGQVRQYLADRGVTEIAILAVSRDHHVAPDEFPTIMKELVAQKQHLTEIGATEVFVFYKGPVTFAMAVGALLDNWVPAKLFNFSGGRYTLDLILDKRAVIEPGSGPAVTT